MFNEEISTSFAQATPDGSCFDHLAIQAASDAYTGENRKEASYNEVARAAVDGSRNFSRLSRDKSTLWNFGLVTDEMKSKAIKKATKTILPVPIGSEKAFTVAVAKSFSDWPKRSKDLRDAGKKYFQGEDGNVDENLVLLLDGTFANAELKAATWERYHFYHILIKSHYSILSNIFPIHQHY